MFFSEGNVAKATLPEEKAVMRPGSLSGVAGILRKSSKVPTKIEGRFRST